MIAGIEQADRLVLAMDFEQEIAQFLEHADAGGLIIDKGARTTVRAQEPAQDQFFARCIA